MIYNAPESYILKIPVSVGSVVANSGSLQSRKILLRFHGDGVMSAPSFIRVHLTSKVISINSLLNIKLIHN
jgi:hypothetical protein